MFMTTKINSLKLPRCVSFIFFTLTFILLTLLFIILISLLFHVYAGFEAS